MAEKKNQHFVPVCYLKMFALEGERCIRVYNLKRKKFIESASIRDQASKPYFYGKDLKVENNLSKLEGDFSRLLKDIRNGKFPERHEKQQPYSFIQRLSRDYKALLFFIALTDFRNPVRTQQFGIISKILKKEYRASDEYINLKKDGEELISGYTGSNPYLLKGLELVKKGIKKWEEDDDEVLASLAFVSRVTDSISDLNFKVLINETAIPFITSDYPVVNYNQWAEQIAKIMGGGYSSTGAQFFVPISDRIQILIYDEKIYHLEDMTSNVASVGIRGVNQINTLQYLNCQSNVYGNERMTEAYIEFLREKAAPFNRANDVNVSKIESVFSNGRGGSSAINVLKTNLDLSFIKFTLYAKGFRLSGDEAYQRK
ncbi:MAG: DUF4238 domain-containing protein [Cytophagales bacterium]|nr:DUF4238 domain-containing protein [Cytophagales bacterium]